MSFLKKHLYVPRFTFLCLSFAVEYLRAPSIYNSEKQKGMSVEFYSILFIWQKIKKWDDTLLCTVQYILGVSDLDMCFPVLWSAWHDLTEHLTNKCSAGKFFHKCVCVCVLTLRTTCKIAPRLQSKANKRCKANKRWQQWEGGVEQETERDRWRDGQTERRRWGWLWQWVVRYSELNELVLKGESLIMM